MKRSHSLVCAVLLTAATACTGPKAPEETPQAKQALPVATQRDLDPRRLARRDCRK